MANNPFPIFDRLVGLETEYAIRFRSDEPLARPAPKYQLYRGLIARLRQRLLVVAARHFKDGVFTAVGGAVWFETERPSSGSGLIEGSTPECRGPRQVLAYQRAQDQLLSAAAAETRLGGDFSLIKNDRDGRNNVYGAQENYEAILATGWRLVLWRIGLVLLLPGVLFAWLGLLLMLAGTLVYFVVASRIQALLQRFHIGHSGVTRILFGSEVADGVPDAHPAPVWLEHVLLFTTRVFTAPLAVGLAGLVRTCAFRNTRHQLLPFLISRAVVTGAGMVDSEGRFQLADKAPAINCVLGFVGVARDRPLFNFGHFFKALCVEMPFAPRDFRDLFAARQRLQIGLGDSNMAEVAEYLRIGTTLLVLDVIEAGELPRVPRVRRPIRALHQICADPTLRAEVPLADGGRTTALQLQRFYLEACRAFLSRRPDAPQEARDVVRRWQQVLDELERPVPRLMGRVDWITKQRLVDGLGESATWEQRKKVDIRYHELSPQGYFSLLDNTGLAPHILTPAEIERAMRSAPPDSPATMRGHYIREFAQGDEVLGVNWKRVTIGRGRSRRVIRLSKYTRRQSSASGGDTGWGVRTRKRG